MKGMPRSPGSGTSSSFGWLLPVPECICARKGGPPLLMNADVTHGGSHNSGLHASSHNSGSSALLELPRHGIQLVSSYLHGFQRMFSLPGSYGKLEADSTDPAALLLMPLTIVLFGATGDLARKKLFPAIYQLCVLGLFPRDLNLVAFGRKRPSDWQAFLRKQLAACTEDDRFNLEDFSRQISFCEGGYDAPDAFVSLGAQMSGHERGEVGNRLFFLAVPPGVFGSISALASTYCRPREGGFFRVMIEKPFGRDLPTFQQLHATTAAHLAEKELFRVDHYLAKEVVLNIATLRWCNQLFEPTWSNQYIESVQITFKEDLGTGGRGGFFDREGIIRDVVQSHLLQAFMWLAMEPPASMSAEAIVQAKLDLLRCVPSLALGPHSAFLAQYGPGGSGEPGYLEDETVPPGSRCPTFASLVLRVENARWRGVPFLFTAGKGMDERVCELRVRYKPNRLSQLMSAGARGEAAAGGGGVGSVGSVGGGIGGGGGGGGDEATCNELVMRVQPDEALYMLTVAKEPGLTTEQVRKQVVMDMTYAQQFADAYVGDAYERVLLAAGRGDHSLFVSAAELAESWRIFTPLLHTIEQRQPPPVVHPFGLLPQGFVAWAARLGVTIHPTWKEFVVTHAELIDEIVRVFSEMDTDNSGGLEANEVAVLAKRFFDGREPTPERITALFKGFDLNDDGKITLDEIIAGAQKLHRAFSKECNGPDLHGAREHVHV
jgi:glucose-6-phosphate 1-dehydrogenase